MTTTDPEVERLANICAQAYRDAVEAWFDAPTQDTREPSPTIFWRAVARAVIADRAAQEPVTDGPTLMAERDALQRRLDSIATQEPASVPAGEWTPERVAAFNAPHHCLACGHEVGPAPSWHECGPRRASEPVLSPADILDGAEEMLRRIAATACLDLDATEAGAIVAELDRLRALCDEVSAQNAMVRHERDEALRSRVTDAETRSADIDDRLVEYGRRAERAAVCAYLRAVGCSLIPDAIERGEHLPTKEPQP